MGVPKNILKLIEKGTKDKKGFNGDLFDVVQTGRFTIVDANYVAHMYKKKAGSDLDKFARNTVTWRLGDVIAEARKEGNEDKQFVFVVVADKSSLVPIQKAETQKKRTERADAEPYDASVVLKRHPPVDGVRGALSDWAVSTANGIEPLNCERLMTTRALRQDIFRTMLRIMCSITSGSDFPKNVTVVMDVLDPGYAPIPREGVDPMFDHCFGLQRAYAFGPIATRMLQIKPGLTGEGEFSAIGWATKINAEFKEPSQVWSNDNDVTVACVLRNITFVQQVYKDKRDCAGGKFHVRTFTEEKNNELRRFAEFVACYSNDYINHINVFGKNKLVATMFDIFSATAVGCSNSDNREQRLGNFAKHAMVDTKSRQGKKKKKGEVLMMCDDDAFPDDARVSDYVSLACDHLDYIKEGVWPGQCMPPNGFFFERIDQGFDWERTS